MNCIYQMWDGTLPEGEAAGAAEMALYAQRIGARYRFDLNECYFPGLKPSYGRFRVLHDSAFDEFENVMYADAPIPRITARIWARRCRPTTPRF